MIYYFLQRSVFVNAIYFLFHQNIVVYKKILNQVIDVRKMIDKYAENN